MPLSVTEKDKKYSLFHPKSTEERKLCEREKKTFSFFQRATLLQKNCCDRDKSIGGKKEKALFVLAHFKDAKLKLSLTETPESDYKE